MVNVNPMAKATIRMIMCTRITAFLILRIFLPRVAIIKVGNAIRIENNPAVETAILSGAPNSLKNNGTTA